MIYGDGGDLIRATRATTAVPWVFDRVIDELDSPAPDGFPTMTDDGLTIWFESDRNNAKEIITATRPARDQPFSAATRVDELNLAGTESADPAVSGDGTTMIFGSDRDGTFDLFISTRVCQ
jgi:Tol biopolymer transport system component